MAASDRFKVKKALRDIAYPSDIKIDGDSPPRLRVKSKDAAVYAANVMAADMGAKSIGDSDPAFTLQPGAEVTRLGPSVGNAHNVLYVPVSVPGHEGPFFIRSSSVEEYSLLPMTVTTEPKAPGKGIPWWQYALLAAGGLAVVVGGYKLVTGNRKVAR
jgi:hypothetical protein